MKNFNLTILAIFLSLLASISTAGELTYDCYIKNIYSLGDNGELQESGFQNVFEGDEFSVSRETGKIIGKTLTTSLAKNTSVVNSGSDIDSFKAVAIFNRQIQIIEIQEYKETIAKPFIAASMGGVGIVTGFCK